MPLVLQYKLFFTEEQVEFYKYAFMTDFEQCDHKYCSKGKVYIESFFSIKIFGRSLRTEKKPQKFTHLHIYLTNAFLIQTYIIFWVIIKCVYSIYKHNLTQGHPLYTEILFLKLANFYQYKSIKF